MALTKGGKQHSSVDGGGTHCLADAAAAQQIKLGRHTRFLVTAHPCTTTLKLRLPSAYSFTSSRERHQSAHASYMKTVSSCIRAKGAVVHTCKLCSLQFQDVHAQEKLQRELVAAGSLLCRGLIIAVGVLEVDVLPVDQQSCSHGSHSQQSSLPFCCALFIALHKPWGEVPSCGDCSLQVLT